MLTNHSYIFFGLMSIQIFCPFLTWLSFYSEAVRVVCVFWIHIFYKIHDLQTFSPCLWFVFPFSWWCLLKHKRFEIWWGPLCHCFLLWIMILLLCPRNLWLTQIFFQKKNQKNNVSCHVKMTQNSNFSANE